MFKNMKLVLLAVVFCGIAMAAGVKEKFASDELQIGKPSSTDNKAFIVDVGDGATNPALTVKMPEKEFTFNKALSIVNSKLQTGDGTAADQEFIFDIGQVAANPRFKWDNATEALSFSNDGVNFKKIGSGGGGGGGINLLAEENADFESALDGWVVNGGTSAVESVNFLFGENSALWTPAGAGNTFESIPVNPTHGFLGRTCEVEINYSYPGAAGEYLLKVIHTDASNSNLVTEIVNYTLPPAASSKKESVAFDCPDDVADTLVLRVESAIAGASAITLDNMFIGTGIVSSNVASSTIQTKYLGADVTSPGVMADLTFTNLIPGRKYRMHLFGSIDYLSTSEPVNAGVLAKHGTEDLCTVQTTVRQSSGTLDEGDLRAGCTKSFIATGNSLTVEAVGNLQGLARTTITGNGTGTGTYVQLEEVFVGEAINLATSGQYWEGRIIKTDGNQLVGLTTTNTSLTIPNELSSANMELVLDTGNTGHLKMTCSVPEAPSGNSCTGTGALGVAFTPASSGKHEICFEFVSTIGGGAARGIRNYWFFTEYSAAGVLLNRDDNVISNSTYDSSSAAHSDIESMDLCITRDMMVGTERIFKLGQNRTIINAVPTSNLVGDFLTNQVMKFTVRNLDEQKPAPVILSVKEGLQKRVQSNANTVMHSCAMQFQPSPSTILVDTNSNGMCDWVDTTTRLAVGRGYITPKPGTFAGKPVCTVTYHLPYTTASGAIRSCSTDTETDTNIGVQCWAGSSVSSGFNVDALFNVICHGKK